MITALSKHCDDTNHGLLRILVVEDDITIRKLIVRSLNQSGLRFSALSEAGNGQMALDMLKADQFDLVLVDIAMPVMNGLDMVKRMRQNFDTKRIPVIFISGEAQSPTKDLDAGFISKPFGPETLAINIVNMICA